jgi:hypothetical protein
VHLCQQWDMAIKSMFYRHKPNDLYTWYSNANTRSQLDHILMVRTSPIRVMDCRAYRLSMGYLGTDHCLLVCDVRTYFHPRQTSAPRMRYDVTLLANEDVCAQYQREIGALTANYGSPNEQWQALRDGICQAGANNLLLQREIHRRHSWLTAEALQAIHAKGAAWLACKGGDVLGTEARTRYTTLKNLARRLLRRDKRAHLEAHAQRAEEAFRDHKWHDAYKHLKTLGADQEVSLTTIRIQRVIS